MMKKKYANPTIELLLSFHPDVMRVSGEMDDGVIIDFNDSWIKGGNV